MQVTTTRFGTVEVPDDGLVTFADGLPGFGGPRTMALFGAGDIAGASAADGHQNLFWLQDVGDPDLAFLTIVPWSAYPDYDIEIDPDEIDHADADDVCVLNVVTVRREHGGMQMTANLLAPIVIDTARRTGRQLILDDPALPIQAPLAESSNATGDEITC
ncbi:MAG TPA: flagellar assembly protein FliW [Ilumatobacter sp.]|nr:flagellar assembly protein FliW [Ilumatobacter sp.]